MKISALTLRSNRLNDQFRFYTEKLDLPCIHEAPDTFTVAAGSSLLTFTHTDDPLPSAYHFAFNVQPASIFNAQAFLEGRHISPINADGVILHDFTDWNAKAIYFYDADGNIVEFIARFNLFPTEAERPFLVTDIVNISEMGIVADMVADFVENARLHLHQHVWKEYGPDFKAIGNEEGLLITVPPNRNWFPTSQPAVAMPATISLEADGPPLQYHGYHFNLQLVL